MNTQKEFAPILVLLIVLTITGVGIYFYIENKNQISDSQNITIDKEKNLNEESSKNNINEDILENEKIKETEEMQKRKMLDNYYNYVDSRKKVYKGEYIVSGTYKVYTRGFDYNGQIIFTVDQDSLKKLPIQDEGSELFQIKNTVDLASDFGIDMDMLSREIVKKGEVCGYAGIAKISIASYEYLPPALGGKGGDSNTVMVSSVFSTSSQEEILCEF